MSNHKVRLMLRSQYKRSATAQEKAEMKKQRHLEGRCVGEGGGGLCVSVIVDHEFFSASFTHLVSSSVHGATPW
jgi:hypothetical protein